MALFQTGEKNSTFSDLTTFLHEKEEEEEKEDEATWIKIGMEMGHARSGPSLSFMYFL